jgi:hypothetical protein
VDEHTIPPVTERTMFPYRRDEARREREATRPPQPPQYDPAEYDTSTYPPSPWPAATQRPAAPRPVPSSSSTQGVPYPDRGNPYQQSQYQPEHRPVGPYPSPPSRLPQLDSAARSSQAHARPVPAPQAAAPAPQPVSARSAQSRVTQAQAAAVEASRTSWPAQARSAYPTVDQPRPVAQPAPRWQPDHTGQTGPHTWPPISARPELEEATELAPRPELTGRTAAPDRPAQRKPKPALPPEYEDRPLDRGDRAATRDRVTRTDRGRTDRGRDERGRDERGRDDRLTSSRDEIELARMSLTDSRADEFSSDYSSVAAMERDFEQDREDVAERSLLSAWLVFLLETVVAAAVGLGAWLGFHELWRTEPLMAAGGCGVVLVGMHAVVGWVRRRQTGNAMDLFSSCVVVAVGVAITVLPAAFAIKPT